MERYSRIVSLLVIIGFAVTLQGCSKQAEKQIFSGLIEAANETFEVKFPKQNDDQQAYPEAQAASTSIEEAAEEAGELATGYVLDEVVGQRIVQLVATGAQQFKAHDLQSHQVQSHYTNEVDHSIDEAMDAEKGMTGKGINHMSRHKGRSHKLARSSWSEHKAKAAAAEQRSNTLQHPAEAIASLSSKTLAIRDESIGSSSSVVQKLTNSSKETLSNDFKGGSQDIQVGRAITKELVEGNLPNKLKFECKLWDLHKDGSVKTQFQEVTERSAVPRQTSKDQAVPDDVVYVAYAYPEDDGFGSFLFYDGKGNLTKIMTLEKLGGRNDYQTNMRAIGKDPPNCDLKDSTSFGFEDVKSFCWAVGCKKKNGKKLFRGAPYCMVFEKKDGTYWAFYRDTKVFQATMRRWGEEDTRSRHLAAKNSEPATSQSIIVSIAVALYLFFSK